MGGEVGVVAGGKGVGGVQSWLGLASREGSGGLGPKDGAAATPEGPDPEPRYCSGDDGHAQKERLSGF